MVKAGQKNWKTEQYCKSESVGARNGFFLTYVEGEQRHMTGNEIAFNISVLMPWSKDT